MRTSWRAERACAWVRIRLSSNLGAIPFWNALWSWQEARQETRGSWVVRRNSLPSARLWRTCTPDADLWAESTRHWPIRATEMNLMIAVDLPFVRLDFLKYLIARARQSNAAVVVPRASGRLQPLCAIYRRSFAEVAERSLHAGKYKIDSLFTEVSTSVIAQEELEREGFSGEMFRNLNTPEDWEAAERQASGFGPRASA